MLSLLARRLRRWADSLAEPERESVQPAAARSSERVTSAPSAREPASESHAPGAISLESQKSELEQADRSLPDQPGGPPEDWLSRMSAGPPAHWVERVRQSAPDLLRPEGEGESVMTARVVEPSETQSKPPPPPLRLERQTSTLPLQTQAVGTDESSSSAARIPGEPQSESTGPDRSSNLWREPLARIRSKVERSRRRRTQTAGLQPSPVGLQPSPVGLQSSLASPPSIQESPGDGETIQASRREAGNKSQATRLASHAGETPHRSSVEGPTARDKQSADEAHTVAGKPVQFRSDRTGGEMSEWRMLRIETPKPPPKITEAEKPAARPRTEPPFRQRRPSPPPVATLRGETFSTEAARPIAFKFQMRAEPVPDPGDDHRTRAWPSVVTPPTKPVEPAKVAEPHFASETVSSDRWPELPEPPDYVDEIGVALIDLSRRQRLADEQTGSIWSE